MNVSSVAGTSFVGFKPSRLSAVALERALEKAATLKNGSALEYSSEGDYPVVPFTAQAVRGAEWTTSAGALEAFAPMLEDGIFADEDLVGSKRFAAEVASPKDSARRIADWKSDLSTESDHAFARVLSLLQQNLSDVRVVRVGPAGKDGKLEVDQGLYGVLVVGKSADGKLVGVQFGSVET